MMAPDGGLVRTYAGTVDEGALEDDDELELIVVVEERLEPLLVDVVEAIDDDKVEEIELDVLEILEVLEVLEALEALEVLRDGVEDTEVVDAAVLMQEQPLEILEGKPEHAVVAQAG
jgi:hypothetical protein